MISEQRPPVAEQYFLVQPTNKNAQKLANFWKVFPEHVWIIIISLLATWLLSEPPADIGKIWLPAIFSDNMIVQRDKPIAIWGTATPGLPINIRLGPNRVKVIPSMNGSWSTKLPAMPAGGPYELSIDGIASGIMFRNIAIGDVWLCAGQSNMHMPINRAFHSNKDIQIANYPMLRFFQVLQTPAINPEKNVSGSWKPTNPITVQKFSAVAYYFARKLHLDTKIPIGIIEASTGGSPMSFWMSKESLAQIGENTNDQYTSVIFNGLIAPIIGYGIKGMVWYKGETDAFYVHNYEKLLSCMMRDWRQRWDQGNFPCLCVQLPNYPNRYNFSTDSAFAPIREAQLKCSRSIPNLYLVITIDTAEETAELHPRNKFKIGNRLAQLALTKIYGQNLEIDSPSYKSMQISNNKVVLNFSTNELTVKGKKINGFTVAGDDHIFYPATAQLSKNTNEIVVWSDQTIHPIAVRYAWADNPQCDLYSKSGLPVGPFRTDSWDTSYSMEEQTASYWLKRAYFAKSEPPDIVVLGSSQLLALLGADAYVYRKTIDLTGDHCSSVLEHDFQGLLDKHWRVLISTLPKPMISDQLIISRALFSNQYKPKLVAIGLLPRDLIDTDYNSVSTTEPFIFFSKESNLGSNFKSLVDGQTTGFWQDLNLNSVRKMLKETVDSINEDVKVNNKYHFIDYFPLAWYNPFRHIDSNELVITPSDGYVSHDNTEEYRRRYKDPFSQQFQLQLRCFDSLLSDLAQKQIKVVVFDLPLPTTNKKLLPDYFWQYYNQQIGEICKKNGADRINIDADWRSFNNNDFLDSIHLNLPGGLKLTRPIALFSANKFHWKTFDELRHNERRMF